ncbi:hypothetical protein J7L05_03155 [bacterium]|nr:hypothetical protein [bacterium]
MSRLNVFITLFVILFLFGCSSGNNAIIPQTGSNPDSSFASTYNTLPVFVSESDLDGNPSEGKNRDSYLFYNPHG